jgi:hypothetical protein
MDPADFVDGPGRIDDYEGLPCYTPASLPPDLDYTEDLLAVYGDAQYALGRLATLARDIDNPSLLIAPFVHREAAMSSQVEETNVTISDIYQHEVGAEPVGGGTRRRLRGVQLRRQRRPVLGAVGRPDRGALTRGGPPWLGSTPSRRDLKRPSIPREPAPLAPKPRFSVNL